MLARCMVSRHQATRSCPAQLMRPCMRLWDLRTGNCVRTMEGHAGVVRSVDMDGRCRTAVSGSTDKTVRLWDLGSGRCSATFEGHSGLLVRDVVMHESGGSCLSSGSGDYIVNAWAVGCSEAIMRADMRALYLSGNWIHSLFASRDWSKVVYCGISTSTRKLVVEVMSLAVSDCCVTRGDALASVTECCVPQSRSCMQ